LLSLWLLGAVLMGANTFIILGWPTGKPKLEAEGVDKAATQPKEAVNAGNQRDSSGPKEATATKDEPAVRLEPNAGASPGPQIGSGPEVPVPPKPAAPQDQRLSGSSAQPHDQGADIALMAPGQWLFQPSQAGAPSATVPEPRQSEGEWLRVAERGASMRSGPSSSAPRLSNFPPGAEMRVISRERGWVQVADVSGSEMGWIYEKLLEPSDSITSSLPTARNKNVDQQPLQSERVKVSQSAATVRAGPSSESTMLFGFPYGRELRVMSREQGWVQIMDPGSKQVGWVEESAVTPSGAEQQQEAANQAPQRASRGAPAYGSPMFKDPKMAGAWVPLDEDVGTPVAMENPVRPRKWRRGGRFAGALRRAFGGF
jgi:SH3-like domain-containing protein